MTITPGHRCPQHDDGLHARCSCDTEPATLESRADFPDDPEARWIGVEPQSPNPGQSYEAFIESKAGASPPEPEAPKIKRIPIKEFRDLGYLQEVNRLFLHPHGLALEVVVNEDGTESLGGVWDSRDDPEGIYFEPAPDGEKIDQLHSVWQKRADARLGALGYVIQPGGVFRGSARNEPT